MTVPLLPAIVSVLWGISELGLILTKRAKSNAASKDRHSLVVIWIVYPLAVWFGIYAMFAVRAWTFPKPDFFSVLGLGVFLLGQTLRWYSIIYLGRFFTANVAITAGHRLIESGPYRLVRHPSYTGGLLAVFGFALSLANLASMLIIIVPTFTVHLWRMGIEEKALVEAFGDEYRSYMGRTKRLIPLIY